MAVVPLAEPNPFVAELACSSCGRTATRIELSQVGDRWQFRYQGITAGTGSPLPVRTERAAALTRAFIEPLTFQHLRRDADLYDAAGMCSECELVYCFEHWNPTPSGVGTCPVGHRQSLDPHWSPDD